MNESTVFKYAFLLVFKNKRQFVLLPVLIGTITIVSAAMSAIPILFAKGIDRLSEGSDIESGISLILAFSVSLLIASIISQFEWLTFGPFNLRLQRHLTLHVFSHALSLPYQVMRQHSSHEIGRIVEKGLDAVRDITSSLAFSVAPTIVELIIAAFVIAFMVDPWIAAVLIAALCLYGYLANLSAERIRVATENAMESGTEAWTYGLDAIVNVDQVQQANLRSVIMEQLNKRLKLNDAHWKVTFTQRVYYGVLQTIIFGGVVIWVLWRGALDVSTGSLTVGELVLINTYIIRLLQPVETLARVYREMHAAAGEATLLMRLLAENPVPASLCVDLPVSSGPWSLDLRDLGVTIDATPVISGLNLSVPAASRLYIVGPSGAGKSSLLRVLACLVPASSGHFNIENVEVTETNAEAFRNGIAVAYQDCLLFDLTITENIALGSDAPHAAIEAVMAELGLSEVVKRHRDENEPTVGERGSRLSGGEKQRISLARALLKPSHLLLLDEPTAALDEVNRSRVIKALSNRKNKQTAIIVTHDMELIAPNDAVLYMIGPGKIRCGTHGDLLNSKEYSDFINGTISLQTE
ncbi:ATP-binding cassette domain-containing protein [Phyllobacterium sp. 22229]|uniref:ATP-binding cassette domain-containing protein n=1 Tax=Phyllobacterium TaxID=28100 RepID=UPI001029C245|nr:ABC transporter ATP-binding protein [Phyllobacterium myrsinacearum]RZS69839.1 ATP-binding cassette subfamily B protein [Phyllobacterium myrsinacearum]